MDITDRQQIADQCRVVAALSDNLRRISLDYATLVESGRVDNILDIIAKRTKHQMNMLGGRTQWHGRRKSGRRMDGTDLQPGQPMTYVCANLCQNVCTCQPHDVPDCDMGDLYAEWDPESGVIHVINKSPDRYGYPMSAYPLSPDEVRNLYAWVEQHHLP